MSPTQDPSPLPWWVRALSWLQLPQRYRFAALVVVLLLDVIGAALLHAGVGEELVEGFRGKALAILDTGALLLGVAVADNATVEARRRDPSRAAIADDVREDEV